MLALVVGGGVVLRALIARQVSQVDGALALAPVISTIDDDEE
jgi:hypothetical protein